MPERGIGPHHYPEVADNGNAMKRVELLGMKETLTDPSQRRTFFAGLDDDRYTKLLGYINSVTRKQPISYEFADERPPLLETPPLEDKKPLLQKVFGTVRGILAHDGFDDPTALRRGALTMAGAINYIHPYDDGNGRTGRVVHYLMEFGTSRGDQAFNDELYAIIGKLPVYETHYRKALHDTLSQDLTLALDKAVQARDPEHYASIDARSAATKRVELFLDMMRGAVTISINQEVKRRYRDPISQGPTHLVVASAGSLDGLTLYERDSSDHSAIPHYQPEDILPDATRVLGKRPDEDAPSSPLPSFDPLPTWRPPESSESSQVAE